MDFRWLILFGLFGIVLLSGCAQNNSSKNIPNLTQFMGAGGNCETSSQKNLCYSLLADSTKNELLCGKITSPTQKDGCYQTVAAKKKDAKLCDLIVDQTTKDACYRITAIANKNPALCEKISGANIGGLNEVSFKDSCYNSVAEIIGGKENCDKITNSILKDNCYWSVSTVENDKSICNNIKDSGKKADCLADNAPLTNSGLGEEAYNAEKNVWGWD